MSTTFGTSESSNIDDWRSSMAKIGLYFRHHLVTRPKIGTFLRRQRGVAGVLSAVLVGGAFGSVTATRTSDLLAMLDIMVCPV